MKRGTQFEVDAGNEQPGAAQDAYVDVRVGDRDLVEEEIEERVEMGVGVAREERREHVQDAAHGGARDAQGGEAPCHGFHGRERGGPESFEVHNLFAEYEAAVRGCGSLATGASVLEELRREFHVVDDQDNVVVFCAFAFSVCLFINTMLIKGMGRVKLKIRRLENTNGRLATYAKRKNGIMKKASELSILCDIDIILLMFSPTGKPSLCRGKRRFDSLSNYSLPFIIGHSNFEEVIAKFAQLTPQERAKRCI
ncbi:Agamous-like MADS-box protein AGL30, partial [Mucuna pruriens]